MHRLGAASIYTISVQLQGCTGLMNRWLLALYALLLAKCSMQ